MGLIYKDHIKRRNKIDLILFNGEKPAYEEIWECYFNKDKNVIGSPLNEFLKSIEYREGLKPESALKGGRVESIKLYKECDLTINEQIHYVDITSLYPFIQKYKKFPLKHPQIITENFPNLQDIFGLIYCRVLAPRKLYLPTLPIKLNDKLMFALCAKCASLKQQEKCEHTDEERSFEDVYTSEELKQAVIDGYKIQRIFEIWHFPQTSQYNKVIQNDGLFTSYINLFLKGKIEASGLPDNVKTEEEIDTYINEFFASEGIKIDKNNIQNNPGIRNVMKLLLNNFW